jgi:hypothetical protein
VQASHKDADVEVADRHDVVQLPDDLDVLPLQPDLFLALADGGMDQVVVQRVAGSPREGYLALVALHTVCPLRKHDVQRVIVDVEWHQH